jgi:hypothetical protein
MTGVRQIVLDTDSRKRSLFADPIYDSDVCFCAPLVRAAIEFAEYTDYGPLQRPGADDSNTWAPPGDEHRPKVLLINVAAAVGHLGEIP